MDAQIKAAKEAGIDFFNFCWYYSKGTDVSADPKNNALQLYLKSNNKLGLGFSLMIANHQGYVFEASKWQQLVNEWLKLLNRKEAVTVNGKPLISFFSFASLVKTFGNEDRLRNAISLFRKEAKENGLAGITIAALDVSSPSDAVRAAACGLDIISGYNHHSYGLSNSKSKTASIAQMSVRETRLWSAKAKITSLKQIPCITLNWDPRPKLTNDDCERFEGYSRESVKNSICATKRWVTTNIDKVTKEKIVFAYAWNEYAEGAWLTPSKMLGNSLLKGVKEGLSCK